MEDSPMHGPPEQEYSTLEGSMTEGYSGPGANADTALAATDPSNLCKYKSGKCANPRATKRNGQLHTLCHFHRDRQNEHQRKSDRKHRMESVARRAAKLGASGTSATGRRSRRNSISSISSDLVSSCESAPASPMDTGHGYDERARLIGDMDDHFAPSSHHVHSTAEAASAILHIKSCQHEVIPRLRSVTAQESMRYASDDLELNQSRSLRSASMPAVSTRLPPISFLTQQQPLTPLGSKLESLRASTHAQLPPSSLLRPQHASEASKTA